MSILSNFSGILDNSSVQFYKSIPILWVETGFETLKAYMPPLITACNDTVLISMILNSRWGGDGKDLATLSEHDKNSLVTFFSTPFVILVRTKAQASALNRKIHRILECLADRLSIEDTKLYKAKDEAVNSSVPFDAIYYDETDMPCEIKLRVKDRIILLASFHLPNITTLVSGRFGTVIALQSEGVLISFDKTGYGQSEVTALITATKLLVRTGPGEFVTRQIIPVRSAFGVSVSSARGVLFSADLPVFIDITPNNCHFPQKWTSLSLLFAFATVIKISQISVVCSVNSITCYRSLLFSRPNVAAFLCEAPTLNTPLDVRLPNRRAVDGVCSRELSILKESVVVYIP